MIGLTVQPTLECAVWFWIALLVATMAFELWYMVAFLIAYRRIREFTLLFPMAQALLQLSAFAYLSLATLNDWPLNLIIVLGPLLGALGLSMYWRRAPIGLLMFLKSYPRGTLDVLALRRPAANLKRRVRTK